MFSFKLGSKVDPLFKVGRAGRELSTDGKISSPRTASARHAYLQLCLQVLREEISADLLQPLLEMFIHSMPDKVKEATIAACFSYLSRNVVPLF
jgi:hypothetical protein